MTRPWSRFLLECAVGLALAAGDPRRHSGLMGVVGLGGLLHLDNHLYDDWIAGAWSVQHLLAETLPLAILAALPLWLAARTCE